MYDKRFHCSLYTMHYKFHYYLMEKIQQFSMVFVSGSSPREHVNIHTKQICRRTLKRTIAQIEKMVNTIERTYDMVLLYGKQEAAWKHRTRYERNPKSKKAGPYLVRQEITIIIYEMARTVYASERR